ncbi:hypothetical protein N0B44_17790 [Roseibacterium beibuensis]|uniref:hypothetical protein n=1 Tax=[Roseibacterium] beibuensis TaxID=1193142 RepID=UPI00217E03B7|nr:hypothetical protein [Roseibacterium beibuensis]MCS6624771.1 hypothetical protein [Roseibacterium beibuensis]
MLRPWLIGLMALGLGAGTALAQDPSAPPSPDEAPQDPPAVTVDDVVVVGGALETLAEDFATNLAAPARRRGLARWEGRVCLGVVNFRLEVAQSIADRISDVARGLAVRLSEPGCEPNLLIVGTTDGAGLAETMVRRYRSEFFRFGFTSSNRGSAALEAFQTSDAPVRWWHVSLPVVRRTGRPAIRLPGKRPASNPCRTRSGSWAGHCDAVTDQLIKMMVIVDIDALEGANLSQLADYLALIALAQVEPDADYSRFETVLNLFEPNTTVSGLTEWDHIYLRALYSGRPEHLTVGEQARRMVPALRDAHSRE